MEMLGNYQMTTALSNKNAGTCRWCYAIRGGKEYFIKEFVDPKYPTADSKASAAAIERKLESCRAFEKKMHRIYESVNNGSDGNAVRVEEFFRVGPKYYMAMPRINASSMDIREICRLGDPLKRRICAVIAHALSGLHSNHFVHSDIKHNNIMFTHSRGGALTAKLIDYEAGFFEDDPPECADAVMGDPIYYSPEAWVAMTAEIINLTCKLDVFALGVLFHQYFAGDLPIFDMEQFSCAGEALASGGEVKVSENMMPDVRKLISSMLEADPARRPTAWEVYRQLIGEDAAGTEDKGGRGKGGSRDDGNGGNGGGFVPDPLGKKGWGKLTLD